MYTKQGKLSSRFIDELTHSLHELIIWTDECLERKTNNIQKKTSESNNSSRFHVRIILISLELPA